MKSKLMFSPQALMDLDDIWDHISQTLFNQDAERTVDDILEKIDLNVLFGDLE